MAPVGQSFVGSSIPAFPAPPFASPPPFNSPPLASNLFFLAGKTTLATSLGKVLGLPVFYEEVIENEYLADFYKDMKKYAFPLQIYLLNRRFRQHQQIIWQGKGGVQDRTIYEDSVFARMLMESGNMDERDYRTYTELFNNMANFSMFPPFFSRFNFCFSNCVLS